MQGFEPYVMVARRFVPWYDERFRGYRKNKVVHLLHMWEIGLQYVATPHAFVVHSPHPTANSWTITKRTGFWVKVGTLLGVCVKTQSVCRDHEIMKPCGRPCGRGQG